ncbi:MAG: hypothetical protein WBO55_14075 [Rhizobiaceae bacterium]
MEPESALGNWESERADANLPEIDPSYECVFRTSSAATVRQAYDALAAAGCAPETDEEYVLPTVAAGRRNRESYSLWVAPASVDMATRVISGLVLESEIDPRFLYTKQKPWVATFYKWLGRVVGVLVLLWLTFAAKSCLGAL